MKELKATRVPPGDRWSVVDGDDDKIYSSLTEVLNVIFMQTGISEFYMDAKKGEVHIEDGKAKPEPIKKFSFCSPKNTVLIEDKIAKAAVLDVRKTYKFLASRAESSGSQVFVIIVVSLVWGGKQTTSDLW